MKKDYLITVGLLLVVILLGVFLYVNYGPGNNRVSYNNQETPATSESDDNVTSTPSPDETPASTPTSTPTATADSDSETYNNSDVPQLQSDIHLSDVKEASNGTFNMYLFYGRGCPHCEELIEFLQSLSDQEKAKFNLYTFETWYDNENKALMEDVEVELNVNIGGVPFFIIGDQTFSGYGTSMNDDIIAAIDAEYAKTDRYDLGMSLLQNQ